MAFVLRHYGRALERRPMLTNSATALVLYGCGDCLAQNIEKRINVQSKGKKQYNYERTARLCIFGFCLAGPLLTQWYSLLHRMTSVYRYEYVAMQASSSTGWLSSVGSMYRQVAFEGSAHKSKEVILKVVLDQLLFQAPFLNLYLMTMSLLEGYTVGQGLERCKQNFHDAWGYAVCFWSPWMFLNFSFVPMQLAPLYVNSLALVWNAFLSVLFHQRDYGAEATAAAVTAHTEETDLASVAPEEADPAPITYMSVVKSVSATAGRLLHRTTAAACDIASRSAELSVRVGVARSAAWAAWSVGEAESLERSREGHTHSSFQEQRREQLLELDVLRRTVASQAVRIQLMEEQGTAAAAAEAAAAAAVSRRQLPTNVEASTDGCIRHSQESEDE